MAIIWKCLSQNCFARLIRRLLPLFLAIWHQVDIGLDANQSVTYYQMSYDENSEYQLWALKYQNNTKETSQGVSSGYFYVALIVWILPPFIFTSFLINSYRFCLCACKNQMTNLICPILSVKTIILPIGS